MQLVPVSRFLKIDAHQIVSTIIDLVLSLKKCMFKNIFSPFYDVLVLNMLFHAQVPDTALVSGGREGVNPRQVIRNFFLLKLVNLVCNYFTNSTKFWHHTCGVQYT
jgi:hypothetical protein